MLRLKVRICKIERFFEILSIANSGFIGNEPEIALPRSVIEELNLSKYRS